VQLAQGAGGAGRAPHRLLPAQRARPPGGSALRAARLGAALARRGGADGRPSTPAPGGAAYRCRPILRAPPLLRRAERNAGRGGPRGGPRRGQAPRHGGLVPSPLLEAVAAAAAAARRAGPWLLLADEHGVGERLAGRLRRRRPRGRPGARRRRPRRARRLRRAARPALRTPRADRHLWSLSAAEPAEPAGSGAFAREQETGFYALLDLAQALGRRLSTQGRRGPRSASWRTASADRARRSAPSRQGDAARTGGASCRRSRRSELPAIDVDLGALMSEAPAALDGLLRELESGARSRWRPGGDATAGCRPSSPSAWRRAGRDAPYRAAGSI